MLSHEFNIRPMTPVFGASVIGDMGVQGSAFLASATLAITPRMEVNARCLCSENMHVLRSCREYSSQRVCEGNNGFRTIRDESSIVVNKASELS